MGKDNRRQMGVINNKRRFKTRICGKSTQIGNCANKSKRGTFRYYTFGGRKIIAKRGNRASTPTGFDKRVLLYLFPSKKENRRLKTCNKLETPKQIYQKTTFQDGLSEQSFKDGTSRRLGHLNRPERCVSAHTSSQRSQEIPEILYSRHSIPIQLPMFWTNNGSKGIYKNMCSSSSSIEIAQCPSSSIPGRLVSTQSVKTGLNTKHGSYNKTFSRFGFYSKQRKVKFSPRSNCSVHRGHVSVQKRCCLSDLRKDTKNSGSMFEFETEPNCSKFSESVGTNGIMHRDSAKCSSVYEANTTSPVTILAASADGIECDDSIQSRVMEPFEMVDGKGKFAKGQTFLSTDKHKSDSDRCVSSGLWSAPRKSNISGCMGRRNEKQTHKLSRTYGGISSASSFSSTHQKSKCSDKVGQYNSSAIFKQARRHKIHDALHKDLGSVELGNRTQHTNKSSSYCRKEKCFGRQSEQSKNKTLRMVIEDRTGAKIIQPLGRTYDRSVCIGRKSQNTDILFMDSKSKSTSNGCSDNAMGKSVCLRISPNFNDTKSDSAHEKIQMQNNFHSTKMATKKLLHRPSSTVGGLPEEVTSSERLTNAAEVRGSTSKQRNVSSDSLVVVNEHFRKKGFSKESRKLLLASWRLGTQKDYECKFDRFSCWCGQRQISADHATLKDGLDFLSWLYHEGKMYRTIAGYRSMLSAIMKPVEGMPFGKHPTVVRLMKGVFNSRPPVRTLVPEWDLKKVLDMLSAEPFEPIDTISLENLTLKSVFLVAVSTFKRCSDLEALRVDEGHMKVVPEGIVCLREGLAKQDRPGHFGKKILIPCFKENQLVDPKRAVESYIKSTSDVRTNKNKNCLFLSYKTPHNPVSRQTISSWITKVIKRAYADSELTVKAHSTRAIGTSWALGKGASLQAVLEAADWSQASTFKKHYYRDIYSTEWSL